MQIRFGYELIYTCPKPTPMILTLSLHFSRVSDVVRPDHLVTSPSVPIRAYLRLVSLRSGVHRDNAAVRGVRSARRLRARAFADSARRRP